MERTYWRVRVEDGQAEPYDAGSMGSPVFGPDGRLFFGSDVRQFITVGFLGGFTTFSAFSLQTLSLLRDGDWLRAGAYIVGSVVVCLLAVWLGHVAATALNQLKGA